MPQNKTHAVMASRTVKDDRDDFPTPPWATRALLEFLNSGSPNWTASQTVWEPACGRGHMARTLTEKFGQVIASDRHDYGDGYAVADFLEDDIAVATNGAIDWIITNPPFRYAYEFIERALELAEGGVAIFGRLQLLEGVKRYGLYKKYPPSAILPFVERVPIHQGTVKAKASTATAYLWIVWSKGPRFMMDTPTIFIDPCRKRLERPEDYDE